MNFSSLILALLLIIGVKNQIFLLKNCAYVQLGNCLSCNLGYVLINNNCNTCQDGYTMQNTQCVQGSLNGADYQPIYDPSTPYLYQPIDQSSANLYVDSNCKTLSNNNGCN
jgi:hypothetical protein